MSDIVSFGEWIQKRRNQLRYSRTKFAKLVGCAPITIKKIERDERRPSEEMAELFAQHLQIPETEKAPFIRKARGEFVARFGNPEEMSLAEAQAPTDEEDRPKHNLPLQTTRFFGRTSELEEIAEKLSDPNCRVLTILGAGGMGKTRLGIESGQKFVPNFTDGVAYIPLSAIAAPSTEELLHPLVGALADALKISLHGRQKPEQQLITYLSRKEMLLVFDNVEHLVDYVDFLSDLITLAPDIKILTTSRERLNLQEEWIFNLAGLTYEIKSHTDAGISDAMNMFAQRAKQIQPSFDLERERSAVRRICELVEGMPLGLELAASWTRHMPCHVIATEIETEIDFLSSNLRNVRKDHRSIRAVFSTSWQKLSEEEQATLKQVSIFRGGFEREAAVAIGNATLWLLTQLVDKSLLSVDANGRYHIHELLRQFAAEILTESPTEKIEAERRFGYYFLAFLSDQELEIKGPRMLHAIRKIETDLENIRQALIWAPDNAPELLDRSIAAVLLIFFELKSWYVEGEEVFGLLVVSLQKRWLVSPPVEDKEIKEEARIRWLTFYAHHCFYLFRIGHPQTITNLKDALAQLSENDSQERWLRGICLWLLAAANGFSRDQLKYKPVFALLDEAKKLLKEAEDLYYYGSCLHLETQFGLYSGNHEICVSSLGESKQLYETLQDPHAKAYLFSSYGRMAALRGELDEAERYQKESLAIRQSIDHRLGVVNSFRDLGQVFQLQGKFRDAENAYRQSILIIDALNIDSTEAYWPLADLAVAECRFGLAKELYQRYPKGSDMVLVGSPGWAWLGLQENEEASRYFAQGLRYMLDSDTQPVGLDALIGFAHQKAQDGNFDEAIALLALVLNHPANSFDLRTRAQNRLNDLAAELAPKRITEAEARGRELDLFETAEALLADFDLDDI